MKRYDFDWTYVGIERNEREDGDWVRYEDALAFYSKELDRAYAEGRGDEREEAMAAMQRAKVAYYMHGRDQAAEFARHAGYPELASSIGANWAAPGWLPPLCRSCDGSGEREVFVQSGGSMPENAADGYDETVPCPDCRGTGTVNAKPGPGETVAGAQEPNEHESVLSDEEIEEGLRDHGVTVYGPRAEDFVAGARFVLSRIGKQQESEKQ